MSKFTKAAPFEFEGIEVGRETNVPNGYSTRVWVGNGNREGFIEPEDARAVHALIEAESNVWHEAGKGFRKKSWFVMHTTLRLAGTDGWLLAHDDVMDTAAWSKATAWQATGLTGGVIREFAAWHATNYPPAPVEPTKLGYVGTILSKYGSTHHVYRYYSDSYGYAYSLVGLAAGGEARGLSWGVVLQAGKFTAVAS